MSERKPVVFARDATGLVREISKLDAFAGSMGTASVSLGVLTYTTASYLFPGSDPVTATLIATFFSIFVALMYSLFTWAMPRSGGDYVWMSRILHPALGFALNFHVTVWYLFFIGIMTNQATTFGLSPSILIVAQVTGNQSLVDLSNALLKPENVVIIGIFIVLVNAALLVRGPRAIFTFNNVVFVLSMVGLAVALWLLATSTRTDFIRGLGRFASYDELIAAAHAAGYSPQGPNPLIATLGVMPFIYYSTGFTYYASYYAGEVKSVRSNIFYSQVVAVLVVGGLLALLAALAIPIFGYDFLGSISQLAYTGAAAYPFGVWPYFNLFVSMLTDNIVLIWLLGLGFMASLLLALPPTLMAGTRNIFAWSFDRVVPIKLSEIHDRTHSPLYAIIVVAAVQLLGLFVYTFGPPELLLSLYSGAGMAEMLTFIVVAMAAIVFPFRKRNLYEKSPADIKVGPVPLICIAGVISLAFFLMLEYFFLTNSLYGANVPPVYTAIATSLLAGLVIFAASYYYRKSKGQDLSLAFREIPPE